ncbi:hypothetical protein [Flavivirga jejuensis]|uniref:Outer membrane lipoprotein-sorting protein n=1 Tax=Flavivirga jejuensis TaxID=870487 RepID=A0ABT8WQP3_9FLAO|nr:hypothetical protein [Flavivirga jejuensis]MDO5975493.1 hypothetical protein [Flavivirga jejuensis]
MRIPIYILLIIISIKGYSQKTQGIYNYHFDSGGDVISYNELRLYLMKNMTFKLYEIDRDNNSGDTILVSLGKYYKNKDTISFVSPLPDNEDVLFYPTSNNYKKKDSLRISFHQKGNNFYANVNSLSFFSIDSANERTNIVPYDTIPISDFNKLMSYEDLDLYFSYFLRLPKQSKYLMICSDKERVALKGCITLNLSEFRINDIAMRKEKVNSFNFRYINFLDFTNFKFILKRKELISVNRIFPEGVITFIKE